MEIQQRLWQDGEWTVTHGPETFEEANFVLYFSAQHLLGKDVNYGELEGFYPDADIIGCTTGGEVIGDEVLDGSIVVTAMKLERTSVRVALRRNEGADDSHHTGKRLAEELKGEGLNNIFILSDGLNVNGTALVEGFQAVLGNSVILTGGLAGDGADFQETLVGWNHLPESHNVLAVGFYGDHFHVGHGSLGGWNPFGPERKVTKAEGSVLYELDGQPALELYKKYLGDEAENLPSSGLLFPLQLRPEGEEDRYIVRTILSVDEEAQSMTFAGEIKEGYIAQLMSANFDRMVDSAGEAAGHALEKIPKDLNGVAVLISCIGRKLVLGPRVSDETEEVDNLLGERIVKCGFYSYGEISPHLITQTCELHNQTMTVTVFAEK